jgi:hypothetical protein
VRRAHRNIFARDIQQIAGHQNDVRASADSQESFMLDLLSILTRAQPGD